MGGTELTAECDRLLLVGFDARGWPWQVVTLEGKFKHFYDYSYCYRLRRFVYSQSGGGVADCRVYLEGKVVSFWAAPSIKVKLDRGHKAERLAELPRKWRDPLARGLDVDSNEVADGPKCPSCYNYHAPRQALFD
jgi:hypothetical protein